MKTCSNWQAAFKCSQCLAGVLLSLAAGWCSISLPAAEPAPLSSPLSPQDSLQHLRVAPGLRVELVAAEPDVIDPVAIAFDEDGRMWVAEMRDYPNGPEPGQQGISQIRVLEDRDGDGRYENPRVFADRLLFVNGVLPWKKGAFVTMAGEVAYMEDIDGDGRADRRVVWFKGFSEQNPQLRVNHPRFGLDNRIYVAGGLRSVTMRDARTPNSPEVSISGMDLRFDPLDTFFEPISGQGQFGLTFDDYGRRFICSNRNPLKHIVLEDHYVRRNPFLAVSATGHDVAVADAASRVYPLSRQWTTSNLHAGQFTAACGVQIYRGTALPAEYRGDGFTCEPTGNLLHHEDVQPAGATFKGRPVREGVEFLASPDEWFRPVNVANGPDGALYVCDMYRAVIEHPQFMPVELKNRPDLRLGDDRGRIYRVVAADWKPSDPRPQLSSVATPHLIALFENENAWRRETAARLIFQRQDRSVVSALEKLARDGSQGTARVHALWALNGLGALNAEMVSTALADRDPRVQEQAAILAERWLGESPELLNKLRGLAESPDARLRFQIALSLSAAPSDENLPALAKIALVGVTDSWTRIAVACAVPEQAGDLLALVLPSLSTSSAGPKASQLQLASELASLAGSRRDAQEVAAVLSSVGSASSQAVGPALQRAVLLGVAQGIARRGSTLSAFVSQLPAYQSAVKDTVNQLFVQAQEAATNRAADETARREAIGLLRHASFETAGSALIELAKSEPSQAVRMAAIDALAAHRDPSIAGVLLAEFPRQTPVIRRAMLDAVLSTADRANLLLDEIEAGRIAATELDPARSNRLLRHRDDNLQARAQKLLAAALPADRQEVLARYQAALKLKSDPQNGREVFSRNCATCHQVAGVGVNVGPDITDSRVKTPEQLLTDILNPNQAIDNNYVSYMLVTKAGQALTGIIAAETSSSVTLKQAEDKVVTLLRDDIEELRSSGLSLMPEGVEKTIPEQQMADLIGFIKNWRYLDGRTPLGAADGKTGP
jgi:putative membrane-bound dehydrogenase-like protein